jgi:hypothetical protein
MSWGIALSGRRRVPAIRMAVGVALAFLALGGATPVAAADPPQAQVIHGVPRTGGVTPAATGTVDQSNPSAGSVESWTYYHSAQTFTAGATGSLTGIDLDLDPYGSDTVNVYIRNVDGATGEPTGSNLDSASQSLSFTPTDVWAHFDLSGSVPVTSGTKYAIVIDLGPTGNIPVVWGLSYTGGEGLYADDASDTSWSHSDDTYGVFDFAFRTYVGSASAVVPGKPTGVGASAGNAQATVSWTAPASDGGATITGYTVTSTPGSKHCATTGALSCTVTGLTNGQAYTFTVTATNSAGTGPASDPSGSVTPKAPEDGLDQSNPAVGIASWYYRHLAQTFTAGASGHLSGVELYIGAGTQAQVSVYIRAVDSNGLPTGPNLDASSATVPVQSGQWIHFTLSGSVAVDPGSKYAIVFDLGASSDVHASWGYSYSGGQGLKAVDTADTSWSNQDTSYGAWDFAFRTFVAVPKASTYHPITPVRLLDTRATPTNGHSGKLTAKTPITFQITGRGGVPSGASAVTGNLTVTESTAAWAIYLGPTPIVNPSSSTINFTTGQTIANGLTVALSSTGSLSATYLGPSGAKTSLVFDVTGYYTPDTSGQTYHPIAPVRDVDTRIPKGLASKLKAKTPACFDVAGVNGVPAAAKAVTGNVTVADPTSAWALYLGPLNTSSPTTSTLNFLAGQVASNNVTVALDASGKLCATYLGPTGATTNLVFDVTGYYTADATGAAFVPIDPVRLLDTRVSPTNGLAGKFTVGTPRTFAVTGRGGVPAGATAVTGNLTVTDESAGWAIYIGPDPLSAPPSSSLNFVLGDIKANGVSVALSGSGTLSPTYLGPAGATTHLVFDCTGYFVN